MKKRWKRRLITLALVTTMMLSGTISAFAANEDVSSVEKEVTTEMGKETRDGLVTIKEFPAGAYYMAKEIPFTINDSSGLVKVMYSAKYVDGTTMTASVRITNSSGRVVWSRTRLSGNQILEVGKLATGNYTLTFIPGNLAGQYALAGKLYYFYG